MITVEQVLHLEGLGLETVVPGDTSLPVAWVAASELTDPTPYLNGGEILLFTGLNSPTSRSSWQEYVGRLVRRGVVALGLGLGEELVLERVPPELEAAVEGTGLTLFSVPQETPFLGIIQAVAALRSAEERAALERSLAHQRALTRAATASGGSAQVLRALAGLLPGSWAAVCTAEGNIRDRSAPGSPPLPSNLDLGQLLARLRGAGLRGSLSESGPHGGVIIHPLGIHGDPHGYLVVVLRGPLERAQAGAITTAVALLSLHAERAAEQLQSRRRIRAGAVALFLVGDIRAGDALLAVAGDRAWGETVRRMRAVLLRGSPERTQEALRRIEAHTESGRRLLVGTPVANGGQEDTAVLVEDAGPVLAQLRRIVELADLRAGIGGGAALADAATSHGEALETLERTAGHRRIGTWDDTVAGGVAGLLPPKTARAWAREVLRPLSAQGVEGERLLATLRLFLAYNGNRRQTAEDLGVHRNTLLHQLQHIERALQRPLDDPQLRADLWIALNLPGE